MSHKNRKIQKKIEKKENGKNAKRKNEKAESLKMSTQNHR